MDEIELQLKENQDLYVEIRKLVAIRKSTISLTNYRMFYEDMYKLLLIMYDESDKSKDPEKTKSWVARELVGFLIPQLEWFMDRRISDEDLTMSYRTWDKCMALASRRSFHHFLLYMEMDRQPDRQIYSNRLDILGGIVYYLNKMHVEPQFMDLVGSFPPSFGKCLHPMTPVLTVNGNIPIKDIKVGDKVYSMKDKKVVIETVTNKWDTKKKQVKITTRSGKEMIMSPEHKMFTVDGYKEAKNITTKDYLYRLNSSIEPNEPHEITDDELFYLTSMIFEGHCKEGRLNFTGNPNEYTDKFLSTCENLGFNTSTLKKQGTDCLRINVKVNELGVNGKPSINQGYELLRKYGLNDVMATEKRLPKEFFNLSVRQKKLFFGMMFATDGYLSKNDVGVTLASEGLIDDIIIMLQMVGVFSAKSHKKTELNGKLFDSWRLRIPNDIAIDFLEDIELYHKEPDKLRINKAEKLDRGNTFIRYPFSMLEKLKPIGSGGRYNAELRYERKNDRSPRMMERFFDVYPELEEHRYQDFFYEEISKVEFIDEEIDMVDIEVSNTHNFIADGYVSHNSFVGNYFTAWVLGNDYNGSVLRMSYSDDLLNGFSRSIKSLVTEDRFKAIFPYFDKFSNKIFEKEKDSDWLIKGADTLVSHYTRTRDGAVTGIRAKSYIMFDDMTKGAEEAYNDGLHETYWSKYMSEWRNRKNDYKVKEITLGTMWNPNDILSRKGNQLEGKYTPHKGNHPYCNEYHDEEGQVMGVVIRYPLLDENEKSTCELIYSTKDALDIKANTEEFLFSCVYQQDPISQKGRLFSYDEIMTYEFNGNEIFHNGLNIKLSEGSFASLDPVRKGKDFVAMPIFKYDVENPHIYYLIDVLFKGKSMEEVYSEIIGNVTQHNIIKFAIENNTDVSLKAYLEKELKQRGYYSCEMMEKFNTVKKEQRIRDENLPMRKQIVYPKKGLFTANSDMGKFMDNITRFSLEQPNKHDDAPDSVALFVNQIIKDGYRGAKVEAIRRPTGF